MIISDLYETRLEIDDYNPSLYVDSNDALLTVTVTLVDFNKTAVTGKSIKLTVDKGYFKKYVGATTKTISGTTTKTVTVNTDSNGQVKVTYAPSESGLCTFSCNNAKIQCFVDFQNSMDTLRDDIINQIATWEKIDISVGACYLYVNRALHLAELRVSNISASLGFSTNVVYTNAIPSEFRPPNQVLGLTLSRYGKIEVTSDGSIYFMTLLAKKNNYQLCESGVTVGNSSGRDVDCTATNLNESTTDRIKGQNTSCTLLWHYAPYLAEEH